MRAAVPYAPLRAYVRVGTDEELARRCGVNRESVWRWRTHGRIPVAAADKVACVLGVHVLNIWPDFHERYSR